jgi:hypothetical protein
MSIPPRPAIFLVFLALPFLGCLPSFNDNVEERTDLEKVPVAKNIVQSAIDTTLSRNLEGRLLSANRNAAWQVFHGAVAFGLDLPMDVNGDVVFALDYLFQGGQLPGWIPYEGDVIESTGRRGVRLTVEEGSFTGQGHVDQFLGYISQAKVPMDTKLVVGGNEHTVEDWVRQAQRDVSNNPYREYSWTLIALANYLPTDEKWVATDGRTWTLEPFVSFEAKQKLSDSACGGMHRLMGLAHAISYRQKLGEPITGGFEEAKLVVDDAIQKARAYQNSDGSFSTRYSERPGNSADLNLCIGATGHTLEFLAYALPKERLEERWMERAVMRLCAMLDSTIEIDLECGGIYHALAGLKLYRERRFGPINLTETQPPTPE